MIATRRAGTAVRKPDGETLRGCDELAGERLHAIGSFICDDWKRIRAAASLLRKDVPEVVESEVRGGSMGSVIPHRSPIRINCRRPPHDVGQVVAFMSGATAVVHRIVYRGRCGRAKNFLITQGDALLWLDPPVSLESVLGPVIEIRADGIWRPLGPRPLAPRRQRLLTFVLLCTVAMALEISPRFARWLTTKVEASERRLGWMKSILY